MKFLIILSLFVSSIFANPFEDAKNTIVTKNGIIKIGVFPPPPTPFQQTKNRIPRPDEPYSMRRANSLDMKYQVHFFGSDINWVCEYMTSLSKEWDQYKRGIIFVPPLTTKNMKNLVHHKWNTNSKKFIDLIKQIGDVYDVTWKFRGNEVQFFYKNWSVINSNCNKL